MNKTKRLTDTERREQFKKALDFFGMNSPPDDRITPVSYKNYRVLMIEINAIVESQPEYREAETGKVIDLYVPQLIQSLFVLEDLILAGIYQEGDVWKIAWSTELYY